MMSLASFPSRKYRDFEKSSFSVNYGHVELDFSTLMFTLGITLLCGLVFGFAPAFENSRLDVNHTLKETSGQTSGSKRDRKSTRLNSSHPSISYAVFCLKKKTSRSAGNLSNRRSMARE